jgi:hypothetical protein
VKEVVLLKGAKTLWDATAGLAGLVPGGLHERRVSAPAEDPYARMEVRPSNQAERATGSVYLQRYRLDVSIYSRAGAVDSDAIRSTAATKLKSRTEWQSAVSSVAIVDVQPDQPTEAGDSGEQHDGQVTQMSKLSFLITISYSDGG